MTWQIQRTENFEKWCKKEDVHKGNNKYHDKALQDFKNIPLPHNVQTSHFKNDHYECWASRLPDKMRSQGKSGGFRVVFILDLEERILMLQGIFRRPHLDFQGQSGKYQNAYEELVKDLAQRFIEVKA